MDYLQKQCSYSTEQYTPTEGQDPVDDFIFIRKTGSCQHFSTALCFLLRGMGIPCRVTNGFIMGDWNEIGGFFTIRQSHAHAWVEVFFPKSGWIPYDPTPPDTSPPKFIPSSASLSLQPSNISSHPSTPKVIPPQSPSTSPNSTVYSSKLSLPLAVTSPSEISRLMSRYLHR